MASESLFWAMALVGASAKADEFLDSANEGQELGREQASGFQMPEALGDGKYLFPDQGMTLNESDLYPGSAATSLETLQGVYGSDEDMRKAGTDAQARLAEEASETGEAYRVLTGSASMDIPDLTNDPIWGQTDLVIGNIDPITVGFSDCTQETTFTNGGIDAHVPDYRYCTRARTGGGDCEINHNLVVETKGSAAVYVGTYGVSVNTWQFDLRNGTWTASGDGSEFTAVIPKLDYAQVCGGSKVVVDVVGTWDWPEAPVRGGFDSSSVTTILQEPSCENNLIGKIQIIDNGTGGQSWYKYASKVQFRWVSIKEDSWTPEECIEDAHSALGEFCDAEMTAVNPPTGGCKTINGVQICEGDAVYTQLSDPPVPGISKIASGIYVGDLECNYWKGQMPCWIGADGKEHCPNVDTLQESDCIALENDPSCGFVSSECAEGGRDSYGTCFIQTDTWDCGYDVSVPTLDANTEYVCDGPIRCMGEECVDPQSSTSDDFARAVSALQAAEFMAMDGECEVAENAGHSDVENCQVFKGESMECKKAVGGIVDCCQKPEGGPSLAEYIKLIQVTDKLMTSTALEGSAVSGAWTALRTPIANAPEAAWQTVQGNFSSAWDTLTGAATDAAGSGIKQELMQQTAKWVSDSFGQQAADALFTVNEQGLVQLGGSVGSILSTVMTAYMIYSIALILIQLIWQCEQKEFELGAKRELKSCHYVGTYCASKVLGICIEERRSYCCFNSPLSRIIQEQVRPQLGMGWGSAKNPQCDGITPEQMNAVNWEQVNLDEWLGILQSTGNWPGEDLNPEALTGQGNLLATPDRLDVTERTIQRLEDSQITEYRKEAEEELRSNIRTDSLMP